VHPDGRTVYVSDFKWGGVYRTEDRGQNWTRLTDDGLASDRVWTVGLDPASRPEACPRDGAMNDTAIPTTPLWVEGAGVPAVPGLARDLETQVCVVGA